MKRYKPRWTNEAIRSTWDSIFLQDAFMTALSIGIAEIENQEYDIFKKIFLNVLSRTLIQLNEANNNILELPRNRGTLPTWYQLAQQIDILIFKTREAISVIRRRDIRRNDWEVIITRLEECKRQFRVLQGKIIRALPEDSHPNEMYVSQRSILYVYEMAKTLDMGAGVETPGAGRWRNS